MFSFYFASNCREFGFNFYRLNRCNRTSNEDIRTEQAGSPDLNIRSADFPKMMSWVIMNTKAGIFIGIHMIINKYQFESN